MPRGEGDFWQEANRKLVEGLMRKILFILAVCLLSLTSMAQTSTITSFQGNGVITWTNNVTNAIYRMEWASSPTGTWNNSWEPLRAIHSGTNLEMSAVVPMFYRVTTITEAEILTVSANPSTLNNDDDLSVLSVSGGTPPYTWTILDGNKGGLPADNTGANVIYKRINPGDNASQVTDSLGSSAWIIIKQP